MHGGECEQVVAGWYWDRVWLITGDTNPLAVKDFGLTCKENLSNAEVEAIVVGKVIEVVVVIDGGGNGTT